MHTFIHAYIHAYIHTCNHAHIYTYLYTYIGSPGIWKPLWGWGDFGGIPCKIPSRTKQATVAMARSTSSKILAKSKEWSQLLRKLGAAGADDWILLPRFLFEGGEVASHVQRFLQPAKESRKCWTRGDGGWPRHMAVWKRMRSRKKDGASKGSEDPLL